VETYGQTYFEKNLKKKQACRDIVQEIMNFGINQTQLLEILYLLSLEVDDRDTMLAIGDTIKNSISEEQEKIDLSI